MISQTEFASRIGVNKSTVSRWVKSGLVPGHGEKKLIREEEAIDILLRAGKIDPDGHKVGRAKSDDSHDVPSLEFTEWRELKRPSEEEMREIARRQQIAEQIERERRSAIEDAADDEVSAEKITDIYGMDDLPEDLLRMLEDIPSPEKRSQVIKDYWNGKINREKYLILRGEHIHIDEAKGAMERVLHPISKAMDNLHIDFKARFPEASIEQVEWIQEQMNGMKRSVQEYRWE